MRKAFLPSHCCDEHREYVISCPPQPYKTLPFPPRKLKLRDLRSLAWDHRVPENVLHNWSKWRHEHHLPLSLMNLPSSGTRSSFHSRGNESHYLILYNCIIKKSFLYPVNQQAGRVKLFSGPSEGFLRWIPETRCSHSQFTRQTHTHTHTRACCWVRLFLHNFNVKTWANVTKFPQRVSSCHFAKCAASVGPSEASIHSEGKRHSH